MILFVLATDLALRVVGTCRLGYDREWSSYYPQKATARASRIRRRSFPNPCLQTHHHRLRPRAVAHLPPPPNNRHKHSQTSTSHHVYHTTLLQNYFKVGSSSSTTRSTLNFVLCGFWFVFDSNTGQ